MIKNADKVYLETYTTPGNKKINLEIKKLNLKFHRISRELIEDGKENEVKSLNSASALWMRNKKDIKFHLYDIFLKKT